MAIGICNRAICSRQVFGSPQGQTKALTTVLHGWERRCCSPRLSTLRYSYLTGFEAPSHQPSTGFHEFALGLGKSCFEIAVDIDHANNFAADKYRDYNFRLCQLQG